MESRGIWSAKTSMKALASESRQGLALPKGGFGTPHRYMTGQQPGRLKSGAQVGPSSQEAWKAGVRQALAGQRRGGKGWL